MVGVGGYVASQGSGEGDLLSFDEKVTRELAVAAEVAGVDAVQILAPRPGPVQLRDDELETHLR